MQKTNFGGANFYSLSHPVTVKLEGSLAPSSQTVGNQGLAALPSQPAETRPVVVITGRGKTEGRASTLVRLRPEVVKEIKSLVDGPIYLIIELALRHYAQALRVREPGSVEMIKASDLEK